MTLHIGTKLVDAKPMTRADYNVLRGWPLPADENGDDAGYLVEYLDGGQPNHPDYGGYISWSPAGVFNTSYHPYQGMDFGNALATLKMGLKVARAGWNGKGMWLILVPGTPKAALCEGTLYRDALEQESCEILPHIDMWTVNADGRRAMLPGWLASQTDMLAEDWQIIE